MCFSKLSYKLIIKLLVLVIILGCVEVSAQPEESETVIIMVGKFGPDGCELLGKVKGSSKENETEEDTTSYTKRLIRARSNLLNEARKLEEIMCISSTPTILANMKFPVLIRKSCISEMFIDVIKLATENHQIKQADLTF